MKRLRLWSLVVIVGLLLGAAPNPGTLRAAQVESAPLLQTATRRLSTPELTEAARVSGKIDRDTANLYLAYALGDYTKLPEPNRSDVPWHGTLLK